MKFLLVAILVAAVLFTAQAISDEQKTIFKKFYTECTESTGVEADLIVKMRKAEFTDNDEKLAAYYHCMMVKLGFQSPEGAFNVNAITDKIPENLNREDTIKSINLCVASAGEGTPEQSAYKVFKCFIQSVDKEIKFF
ncbi:PREDICTED: general odorant-binding protein 56d-like [Nicrophorus vespilloides]|uniref:General odorant-binding protein 56d-like n=1 Tax=Nicrophorus vespilloides TaxID=110193 RepID=A0ABM1N882_NICVS|nr:PREDICTED: general odorant-binding protein 56d-like [Nicrophorus vespilloides]